MLLLPLSLIVIGLAILERVIFAKGNRNLDKVRGLIGILMVFLLFVISYFITDTNEGIIYVFLSMFTYLFIGIVQDRFNVEGPKYLVLIIGLPIMALLFIKSIQNMINDLYHILLLLIITNTILSFPLKKERDKRELLALGIGILGAMAIFFSYTKFTDPGFILMKQEMVAQEYLREELGLDGFDVYTISTSIISLRGEEKIVGAYDDTGRNIKLVYKNNKIIDWTEEEQSESYNSNEEGRSFTLDATSQTEAEETVVNNFLYTITRDYDGWSEILADIEPHRILIENEKENFNNGIFIKSYTIHRIITVPENGYSNENHILFYHGWEEIVDEYGLIEYEIVNVNFTQLHSQKSNEQIPQWGDGTYSRRFIVGKSSDDKEYKIYDFGMIQEI